MANLSINFNAFLEKEKLKNNGSNFTDWLRGLKIVLRAGQMTYVLEAPLGDPPADDATDDIKNVFATRKNHYSTVQCAILYGLETELQKRFEHHDPFDIIKELKLIFETHATVESLRPLRSSLPVRWKRVAPLASTCSPCLGTQTSSKSWG